MNNNDFIKKRQGNNGAGSGLTRAHARGMGDTPPPRLPNKDPEPRVDNTIQLREADYEPLEYNSELVSDFLAMVFHTALAADEEICCYFDAGYHGYPRSEDALITKLERTRKTASLYMGTATVKRHKDGNIYNRKEQFARWCVLVLDDIGTKIPLEKIPEEFEPTYIIESSPNNFQYGYVFDKPIEDYEQARALIELVYSGGFSDEGGKLVNKKVRLPEGINGKKGTEKYQFRVALRKTDGPLYTPQEVLKALSLSTTWDEILESAHDVRQRNRAVIGTSLWSPMNAQYASMDGVIDPIVEWLADNNLIRSMDGEWIEIYCPWASDHTEGGDTASYSPIGYGDDEFKAHRAYNCFHSHGDSQKTQHFLDFVAENGGPECACYDPAAALVASHVFDSENFTLWGINSTFPRAYGGVKAFDMTHNQPVKTTFIDPKGAAILKRLTVAQLFHTNPSRVVVEGTTFDPSTSARIVTTAGRKQLNTFSPPDWGEGPYDPAIVDVFLDFIEYLVPHPVERKFFLDWLACKVKNLGFRGWGVMMIAKSYGTGRGTLEMILTRLFDPRNCANVSYDDLINPKTVFNEWQSKLMVFTGETKATTSKSFYDAYTKLRDIIDTVPKMIEINHKTKGKEVRFLHTSHLMSSNFEAASNIDNEDRRMFVITNPTQFESPQYFTELHEWADRRNESGGYLFVNHIARYLKQRPVDLAVMNGRAPSTQGKTLMIEAAKDLNTVFVDAFIDGLPTPWSCSAMLIECASKLWSRLEEPKMDWLTNVYSQRTTSGVKTSMRWQGRTIRPRVTAHSSTKVIELDNDAEIFIEEQLTTSAQHTKIRERIHDAIENTDMVALVTYINDQLDLAGR